MNSLTSNTILTTLAISTLALSPISYAEDSCSNNKEIQEVDQQIAALEKQKQALQEQAEALSNLKDLKECLKNHKECLTNEIQDLKNTNHDDCPNQKLKHQARIQFLETQTQAINQALALSKASDLPQVRSIQESIEDRNTEWDVLTGPKLEAEATIADLTQHAKDNNVPQEKLAQLEKIRQALQESTALRQAEFQAIKNVKNLSKKIDALTQDYYSCH